MTYFLIIHTHINTHTIYVQAKKEKWKHIGKQDKKIKITHNFIIRDS